MDGKPSPGGPGVAGTWSVDSVGIHTTKNVGIGTTTALADKALYQAKQQQRNCVVRL